MKSLETDPLTSDDPFALRAPRPIPNSKFKWVVVTLVLLTLAAALNVCLSIAALVTAGQAAAQVKVGHRQ